MANITMRNLKVAEAPKMIHWNAFAKAKLSVKPPLFWNSLTLFTKLSSIQEGPDSIFKQSSIVRDSEGLSSQQAWLANEWYYHRVKGRHGHVNSKIVPNEKEMLVHLYAIIIIIEGNNKFHFHNFFSFLTSKGT